MRNKHMNFLNLPNWRITNITEEKSHFFITAVFVPSKPSECCPTPKEAIKYGTRLRSVKDAPVRGKQVSGILTIQRYKCPECNKIFCDNVPDLEENSRLTGRLVSYIEKQSIRSSFLSVSNDTGVSETTVREIFTRFVERNPWDYASGSPRILGIDDVYIRRTARCILTDIENRKVFDILPKRDIATVYGYLIQMKNRKNIEVVTMDMWRPFFDVVKSAFPGVEAVVDTFHVQRMANKAVNIFLKHLRNSLNLSQRRLYLRDRFILMKRSYNLTEKEKVTLSEWKKKLPLLHAVHELKEEFLSLWRLTDRRKAELAYSHWREKISPEICFAFDNILSAFKNWHHEIFNYFDYKITNAFTESANNLVKTVQKQGRRYSFEIVRAKILYRDYLIDLPNDDRVIHKAIKESSGKSRIQRLKAIREAKDLYLIRQDSKESEM